MFEHFVVVVFESFSCHRCEKMNLSITAGKPNDLQDQEDLLKNGE